MNWSSSVAFVLILLFKKASAVWVRYSVFSAD